MVPSTTTMMSEISKRDIVYLFFKRKNQLLLAFTAALVLSVVGSYVNDRTYRATATIYVVRNVPAIAAAGPTTYNAILDRREVLNSEVELITSKAVAEKVVDELGLGQPSPSPRRRAAPSTFVRMVQSLAGSLRQGMLASGLVDPPGNPKDGIVAGLLSSIEATPGLNSSLITITFRADNPEFAAKAANAFTAVYLRERLFLLRRPGLENFYEQQVVRARAAVLGAENELTTLKSETGVVAAEEQLRLALEEQSRLNTQIREAQSTRQESQQRIAALQRRIDGEPDSVVSSRLVQRSPELAALEKQRLDLEALRAAELNRFSENSDPIREIDRSLVRVREAMVKAPATVVNSESVSPNGIRTMLQTDLYRAESDNAAAVARERSLLERRDAVDEQVSRLDQDATTLKRLTEAANDATRTYETYVRQKEEARIAAETDTRVTNVQVVSPATTPSRPVYPRLVQISVGATLGLILAVGYVFVAEVFSQTLDRREDVERELELPVLASIPYVDARRLSIGGGA